MLSAALLVLCAFAVASAADTKPRTGALITNTKGFWQGACPTFAAVPHGQLTNPAPNGTDGNYQLVPGNAYCIEYVFSVTQQATQDRIVLGPIKSIQGVNVAASVIPGFVEIGPNCANTGCTFLPSDPVGFLQAFRYTFIPSNGCFVALNNVVAMQPQSFPGIDGFTGTGLDFDIAAFCNTACVQNTANAVKSATSPQNGTFTVTLSSPATVATTVFYSVSGSAQPNIDYVALSGSVTFPVGSSAQSVIVQPLGGGLGVNTVVTLTLTSSSDAGTTIGTGEGCNPASIIIFDYIARTACTTGTQNAVKSVTSPQDGSFLISLSNPATVSTTIGYALSGSAQPNIDYVPPSGFVIFPVGATQQSVIIQPLGGGLGVSTFLTLTLTSSSDPTTHIGVGEGCNPASISILDYLDRTACTTGTQNAVKSVTSPQNGSFLITLSNPATVSTTIGYALSGTAQPNVDYVPPSGFVIFPVGTTQQVVTIQPLGGGLGQNTYLTLTLTSSSDPDTLIGSGAGCNPAAIEIIDYEPSCLSSTKKRHAHKPHSHKSTLRHMAKEARDLVK
jgi:hypothetical protein